MLAGVVALALTPSAFARTRPAPYEPEPVQLALDELGVRYPGEDVRYPRPRPEEPDDLPKDERPDARTVQGYASWLAMLSRRAVTAAQTRGQRNWAGHAVEELRLGRKWLARGIDAEVDRGLVPPHRNPVSIAKKLEARRHDKISEAQSDYQIALSVMHRGARYAMAVLKARGLDPAREPVAEEATLPRPR